MTQSRTSRVKSFGELVTITFRKKHLDQHHIPN